MKNIAPYKFLCERKFPVVSQIYHDHIAMFIGSLVSRKECDKVFLNSHIRMFIGLSVSWKECDEIYLSCHIYISLDLQCHGKHGTKFS